MACDAGKYLDLDAGNCSDCASGCAKCSGPDDKHCYALQATYLWNQGKIEKIKLPGCQSIGYEDNDPNKEYCSLCLAGYRPIDQSRATVDHYECKQCQTPNCAYCNQDEAVCTMCQPGYKLESGICTLVAANCKDFDVDFNLCRDCPEGKSWSFETRNCVSCPRECHGCSRSGRCIGCQPGYTFTSETASCQPCLIEGCVNCNDGPDACVACADGFYFDLLRNSCMQCDDSCATCTGPKAEDCESCKVGLNLQTVIFANFDDDIIRLTLQAFREKFPKVMAQANFMARNFHPDKETVCVEKCRDRGFYGDKFQELAMDASPGRCPTVSVLHHLMSTKSSGYYYSGRPSDTEAREAADEAALERRRRTKAAQDDILKREAEDLDESEGDL